MTPQEMLHTVKINHNPIGHYTGFAFVYALEAYLASDAARIAALEAALREIIAGDYHSAHNRADAGSDAWEGPFAKIARAALTDKET